MILHTPSFLQGVEVGVRLRLLRGGSASAPTPVAYLYNGVRLPGLPDAVNNGFSNAIMQIMSRISGQEVASLTLYDFIPYVEYNDSGLGSWSAYGVGTRKYYEYNYETKEWEWDADYTSTEEDNWAGGLLFGWGESFWSNFDVCLKDGTVKTAASEPIPVYE